MEGELTSYSGADAPVSNTFFILSISSWIMVLITSWMPVLVLGTSKNEFISFFWLFVKDKHFYDEGLGLFFKIPLDINFVVFIIIYILTLVIGTIGFISYVFNIYKGNNKVINGMFGETSKFHFIPLFLISGLFIIGESYDNREYDYTFNDAKYIFSIIFTVLSLITLIFIAFRTQIESPWYASLTINKGFYSCLLALLIYNLGYVFTQYGIYRKLKKYLKYLDYLYDYDDDDWDDYDYDDDDDFLGLNSTWNWVKRCYLAFTIVIGILSNAVAFLLKDLVISLMNLLIYLGMLISYFRLEKDIRKALYKHETIGIFEIIMMVISVAYIVFHIIRYRGIVPNQF